jgi:hypothetical protein
MQGVERGASLTAHARIALTQELELRQSTWWRSSAA